MVHSSLVRPIARGLRLSVAIAVSWLLCAQTAPSLAQAVPDSANKPQKLATASAAPTTKTGITPQAPAPSVNKPESREERPLVSQSAEKDLSAKTYVDTPLPDLSSVVREVKGVEPEASHEQLSSILQHASAKCDELLHRTPNVIAREDVTTVMPMQARPGYSLYPPPGIERQTFEYLLISHQTPKGGEFEEYRTLNGRPMKGADQWVQGTLTEGFVTSWLSLVNQSQSRFRYLGRQEIDKHQTFVLAFAQIPEHVENPAMFLFEGKSIPMLFQGIVWIDSNNYQIVRMHEDLLPSAPDAPLKRFTVRIAFGDVRIPEAHLALWLPQDVDIQWRLTSNPMVERSHHYSKYRLYTATVKIVPVGP